MKKLTSQKTDEYIKDLKRWGGMRNRAEVVGFCVRQVWLEVGAVKSRNWDRQDTQNAQEGAKEA